ncbi:MAG: CPBP family intramembrane metalloprotease [Phycisphaerales bacterium]|nr:CPBP family intramembrane metalloprotease [Phycisphaerales bacterium]
MTDPPAGDEIAAIPTARPIALARPIPMADAPIPAVSHAPMLLEGATRGEAAVSLLIVIIAGIVATTVGQILMMVFLPPVTGDAMGWRLVGLKAVDSALACLALSLVMRRHRVSAEAFGIHAKRLATQFGLGLLTLTANYAYMIATIPLFFLFMYFFPQLMEDLRDRAEFGSLLPLDNLLLTVILLTFVVIHEELIFRGLMLPLLRRFFGSWWLAVAISSLIFGGLHIAQGVTGVIQVTGLGVVFSIAFLKSRSLLAVMVAHFAFNFLQFQLMRWQLQFQKSFPDFAAICGWLG